MQSTRCSLTSDLFGHRKVQQRDLHQATRRESRGLPGRGTTKILPGPREPRVGVSRKVTVMLAGIA